MLLHVSVLNTVSRMVLENIEVASVFVGGTDFQYRERENISTVWPGKFLPVMLTLVMHA